MLDRREFAALVIAPVFARALSATGLDLLPARSAAPAINAPAAEFLGGLALQMEIAGVPGVAMSLVHDRRIAWQHYQGVMDATTKQAVSAETMWPAASLSKPIVALAALRLVDDGKLELDRPLKSYVSGHAPDDARGDRVTARHILSHSSGFRNWRQRADQPLVPDFDPGARFQYSGEGFYYLQRAIEHIAGVGFEQFMQERLFAPLGMTSSTYSWRTDVGARLVTGHDQGQPRTNFNKDFAQRLMAVAEQKNRPLASFTHEELVAAMQSMTPAPPTLPNSMLPNAAASLLTTPSDYSAFVIELLNGGNAAAGIKPATREQMFTSHTRINSALSWGLGIGVETQALPSGASNRASSATDSRFLWHWGDNGSWKSFLLAHPASRSAMVIFSNGSRGLNIVRRTLAAATGQERAAFLWL